MATLAEIISGKPRIKEKPIFSAHWVEFHWVYTKGSWAEGARHLQSLFPREARVERPAEWYERLRETHWPDRVPPGNGPYYVPEWAVESEAMEKALEKGGFQKVVAHTAVLPPDSEYLVRAMQGAGKLPWNVDPLLYRAYYYKAKGVKAGELRPYTTSRWEP